jgi:hypothetical protein
MDASDKLFDLVRNLLEQLPSLFAMLACMIFALVRWKRHPPVSAAVLVGVGLLLLHLFVFTAVYNWVPGRFILTATSESYGDRARSVYLVLGLISSSAAAVPLAVLLAAIFMRRPAPLKGK